MAQPREKNRSIFFIGSWIFVAIMLGIIFFMSAQTGEKLNNDSGIITLMLNALSSASVAIFGHEVDVSPVGHFTEYFLLGLALVNALRLTLPLKKAGVLAVVIASLYGVSDEIHQIFVPQRTCDPMDWLVDTIAALLATLIFCACFRLRERSRKGN